MKNKQDVNFNHIKIKGYNNFFLSVVKETAKVVRTPEKPNEDPKLDLVLREFVGKIVYDYNVLVKTVDESFMCVDKETGKLIDTVLCSKLSEKLKNDENFKIEIENTLLSFFNETSVVMFTQSDHIHVFTNVDLGLN